MSRPPRDGSPATPWTDHPAPADLDDADPHQLLFGRDEEDEQHPSGTPSRRSLRNDPVSRRAQRARRRRRRRRRFFVLLSVIVLLAAAFSAWLVVKPAVERHFADKDYPGPGTGQVLVHVEGDASAIGRALVQHGVVRTSSAFVDAYRNNSQAQSIQAGDYQLREHMTGADAVALLVSSDPITIKFILTEGSSAKDVVAKLATTLKVPESAVQQAASDVTQLGIPSGYTVDGAAPTSVEGFLYPDTYSFEPTMSPQDDLAQMVGEFASKDRSLGFATAATQRKITPYQGLTIASMVEGEAKFPEDRAKVAQVIYNRMAKGMPLGIDATSIYGAKLAGQDPTKIDWDAPAPYNTRHSSKLPPTPIGNPGEAALTAAVRPAQGNWLYYVNGDAEGHLYFTASDTDWAKAVDKCVQNHWGCG